MENKKIWLWILVVVVLVGGFYFVSKNSSVVKKENLKLTAEVKELANGRCRYTDPITGVSYIGDMGFSGGHRACLLGKGINGYKWDTNVWYTPSLEGSSDNTGTGIDPNANNADLPLIGFSTPEGEKNFLDWASFTTNTCVSSIEQADSYLKDINYVSKFISEGEANKDSKTLPWDGASNKCVAGDTTTPTAN